MIKNTFSVAVKPAYDFGTAGGANDVLNRVGRIHQSFPAREFVQYGFAGASRDILVALGSGVKLSFGTGANNYDAYDRFGRVPNEITSISPSAGAVNHDAVGNTTLSRPGVTGAWNQTQALKWDAWNRLVARATDTTYRFDALHRRITKTVSSAIRHFYYSDQWQIVEERVGSATTADNQYVWGMRYIDELIYRKRGTTERYVLTDYFHPVAITDTAGNVVERFGYTPFGVVRFMNAAYDTLSAGTEEWRILYAGDYFDDESGFYQNRYRSLNPYTGRWLSRDPIGERGGLNLYAYVGNNAVNRVDQFGLFDFQLDKENCKLQVTVKWKVIFGTHTGTDRSEPLRDTFKPNEGNWNERKKARFLSNSKKKIESYFNNLRFRCIPNGSQSSPSAAVESCCSGCSGGYQVQFNLLHVESGENTEVWVSDRDGRGSANLDGSASHLSNYSDQQTMAHEMGHNLGLRHPGYYTPEPGDDYSADAASLMGSGRQLRLKNFWRAFCSKINDGGPSCQPWLAYDPKGKAPFGLSFAEEEFGIWVDGKRIE